MAITTAEGGASVARLHDLALACDTLVVMMVRAGLPDVLEVTAETAEGVIMGLRHRSWPVEGVQFHPESILTVEGPRLLGNFLRRLSRSSEAGIGRS